MCLLKIRIFFENALTIEQARDIIYVPEDDNPIGSLPCDPGVELK